MHLLLIQRVNRGSNYRRPERAALIHDKIWDFLRCSFFCLCSFVISEKLWVEIILNSRYICDSLKWDFKKTEIFFWDFSTPWDLNHNPIFFLLIYCLYTLPQFHEQAQLAMKELLYRVCLCECIYEAEKEEEILTGVRENKYSDRSQVWPAASQWNAKGVFSHGKTSIQKSERLTAGCGFIWNIQSTQGFIQCV